MARLQEFGAAAGGAGITLGLRQKVDSAGDTSLLRPSVIHGVGVGATMLGLSYAVENRMMDAPVLDPMTFVRSSTDYGVAALATGLFSAFYPRGRTDFTTPTLALPDL